MSSYLIATMASSSNSSNNRIVKSNNSDNTTELDNSTTSETSTTELSATTTNNAARTEREKMIAGEFYQAFDDDLLQDRQRAKLLCYKLNQTNPLETDTRKAILKDMLDMDDDDDEELIKSIWIESPFHVDYGRYLRVGKNFYANHGCTILDCNYVKFGNDCLLAPHVCISAGTHPIDPTLRQQGAEFTGPITIGNNVWIGANATICPNVTLGDNVVVGAGAVVTKSFPSNVVIGGVPAKVIKYVNNNEEENDSGGSYDSSEISESDIIRDRAVMGDRARIATQEEVDAELEQLTLGIVNSMSC